MKVVPVNRIIVRAGYRRIDRSCKHRLPICGIAEHNRLAAAAMFMGNKADGGVKCLAIAADRLIRIDIN